MFTRHTTIRCGTAIGAACLGLLLPAVVAPPASAAGPTTIVTIEPVDHSGSGAAGACLLYRVVPRDAAFEESVTSPDEGFATVTLQEGGDLAQQDLDFCTVGGRGDAFKRAPRYPTGSPDQPRDVFNLYNPGQTLTPEEQANPVKARQDVPPAVTTTNAAGRPDIAATVADASSGSVPANNAKGYDNAIVAYDAEAGGFVFGIAGLVPGAATIKAFFDTNGDGVFTSTAIPGVDPGGDVQAETVTTQFTSGGAPWSLTAANAARTVEATPKTATVAPGSNGVPLTAVVRNADGHTLYGVMVRMAAESGPNSGAAPTWTGSCAATDSSGRATCTYGASNAGTDSVALWVNQAASGATAGRDSGEPFDSVSVLVDPTATSAPTGSPSPATPEAPAEDPSAPASPAPAETTTSAPASPEAPAPEAPSRECESAFVLVERPAIMATEASRVVVQATPGRVVQLLAYSRPSTTYRVVREGTTGEDGSILFTVRPLSNTRLYAQEVGCTASPSQVIEVRSALSLGATRLGPRDFAFRGRAIPTRPGQLVSLYRLAPGGRQVLTAQARVDNAGIWSVRRTFSGTGRFGFVVRTGRDLTNAAASSPIRVVDIR